MDQIDCDVLIIGMGLGASAIAHRLASINARVMMIPGAGCSRFMHLDGGIVDPLVLRSAIGPIESAPLHSIGHHTVFNRAELQAWAINQIRSSVEVVEDFEEARAVPHDSGRVTIVDATGERSIRANSTVLTEGANPKIGIAARVREDFEPEDMIHFGRAKVDGVTVNEPVVGAWRTSWNMPAWYSVIPQPDGALVSASARIENVMRASRDGRDVLKDLLGGPLASELGIQGHYGEIGMELVPLKSGSRPSMIGAHNVLITYDGNGSVDARSLDRYNAILASSTELASMWVSEWPNIPDWDEMGIYPWNSFSTGHTPYHADKESGFIEDGPGKARGVLSRLFNR